MWVLFAEPLVSLQTVLVLESIVTKRGGHMLKLSMFTLNVSFDVMLYWGPQRYIQSRISKHKALKTQASAERKNNKENMMYVCFPSAVFLYDHYEVKV